MSEHRSVWNYFSVRWRTYASVNQVIMGFNNGSFTYQHGATYYRHSIYHGYIWYNSAESSTITMIKCRSDLHSRTTPHTSPLRARYGVSFVSYTNKNDRDISRVYCNYLTPWYISSTESLPEIVYWFIINYTEQNTIYFCKSQCDFNQFKKKCWYHRLKFHQYREKWVVMS